MKAITDEARSRIVKACLKPVLGRLSQQARDEVIENFCIPNCKRRPNSEFCPEAREVYKEFLLLLRNGMSKLN